MSGIDTGAGRAETGSAVLDAERRLDTLVTLMSELRLLESPSEVARRAVQILAGNDADLPAVGFFSVTDAGEGQPVAGSTATTLVAPLMPAAQALAQQVADTAQRQEMAVPDGDAAHTVVLHAYPLAESSVGQPSMILVIVVPDGHIRDATWQGYVDLLVAQLSGVLNGMRELASERLRSRLLTQLDAAKSAFLANVSHELRTPLTLITAPVHDALLEPALPDAVRERLLMAQHNVSRLTRMVDALLDFSRMEAGRIEPALHELDVSSLTRALADSFRPVISQSGLELHTDIAELPRPAMLDHDMYERMVLNLLANAVKYTPHGSITVTLSDAGDRFRVSVTDTGIGISAANRRRIFARFVQLPAHPEARSPEGAGIGLAMVKQLVELLGGRVELDSTVGVGSTFTLDLPYVPDTGLPERPAGARSITRRDADSFLREMTSWRGVSPDATSTRYADVIRETPGGGLRRLRLLIVEDSPDMRSYLGDVLSDEYEIETATDGDEALAVARRQRPHVILSDVMMPGLDGLGFVRRLRADPDLHLTPVLLLSARAGEQAVAEGMDRGADDYIEKPFSLAELRSRLAANVAMALTRSSDAAWRRAVVGALQTALLIADPDGVVTEMNQEFTDLLGWTLEDGPFQPPYPWWPEPSVDPLEYRRLTDAHAGIGEDRPMTGEYRLRRKDGRTVWASYWGTLVTSPDQGRTAIIKSLRDVTREHDSRARREAASRIVAGFAAAQDLDRLVADAVRGLGVLFDGRAYLRLTGQARLATHKELYTTVFTDQGPVPLSELSPVVQTMLDSDDPFRGLTATREPGIIISSDSATAVRCLTWVHFPEPREVPADEFVVGDLIARALDIAVDRILAAETFARREENLERAVESHRFVGQAIGILVERHRVTPSEGFDRLREASQHRNVKLRELARRVIETGADPESA